ncbi:MAG: hypothetical protein J5I93_10450 [Pirellulaceae bacterium]|nr:hypothetical protein [Pirellulaceae bacterium]
MFWELYQQNQIAGVRNAVTRTEVKNEQLRDQVRILEDKLDCLALTCQAMWEILRERGGLNGEDLNQKVQEIDLRDGKLDNRLNRSEDQRACPQCSRLLHRRHLKCLYCGFAAGKENAFQF